MVHNPDWKESKKKEWTTYAGFSKQCASTIPMGTTAWVSVPFREGPNDYDRYIGGLEEIGNTLTYKLRKPDLEVNF